MHILISLLWALLWTFTLWSTLNASLANYRLFTKGGEMPRSTRKSLADQSITLDIMACLSWALLIVFWFN